MALTEFQKVNIRRHLGYPVVGNPRFSPVGGGTLASGTIGYRFHQVYGMLEYRLNNMQPFEEAVILGLATASVVISGSQGQLSAGLTPQVTISSSSVSEVISYTTQLADTVWHVGVGLANSLLANVNLVGAQFNAVSPYTFGTFSEAAKPPAVVQPFPAVQITCLSSSFDVLVVSAPPVILSAEPGSGQFFSPSTTLVNDDGDPIQYNGFLPILDQLEGRVAASSDNLDTEKADVWTARKDEVEIRTKLYNVWRQKLASFMAIPLWEKSGYDTTRRGTGGRSLIA